MASSQLPEPVHVGIIGATGYAGIELVRLLHNHPGAEITFLGSQGSAGKTLGEVFPHIDMMTGSKMLEAFDLNEHADSADVFFLAMENGRAMEIAPELLKRGKRIIDLSADFRLKNPADYPAWYSMDHSSAGLLKQSVYGLPEIYGSQIRMASLVANPGCYTTTTILGLAPALASKAVDPCDLVVDAMSGVSGAGRAKKSTDYMFSELDGNAKAYGVTTHRHTPEMEQELAAVCGCDVRVTFTPHLVPMTRGILSTCYAKMAPDESADDLHSFYTEFYADAPFVNILPLGEFPSVQHVKGSNMCLIGIAVDTRTERLIVVAATDNLIKGAAGQAVQNFNIMIGFPETTNLPQIALYP